MRRRALLATLGSVSAGCLGTSTPEGTSSSRTETPSPSTETATQTAIPTTSPTSCEPPSKTGTDHAEEPPSDTEYEVTQLSVSTSVDRPSFRFVLEPAAFYSKNAVAREEERTGEKQVVVDISEIESTEVRDAIETAIRSGTWRSDSLPDGLTDTVERVDFFTGVSNDDTYTHVGVELHRSNPDVPPAIGFDARVADPYVSPDSPGSIVFSLKNRSPRTQEVFSGTVPPFGMMHAEYDGVGAASRFLLWRDYEEEGCFSRREDGWMRCDIGKVTRLKSCESISREYEILPSSTESYPEETVPARSGEYRTSGSVSSVAGNGSPSSEIAFEVSFRLEE